MSESELNIIHSFNKILTADRILPQDKYIEILKILTKIFDAKNATLELDKRKIEYKRNTTNNKSNNNLILKIDNTKKITINNYNNNLNKDFIKLLEYSLYSNLYATKILELSGIDTLTELPSRLLYEKRKENFKRKKEQENVGICYIDANYLKDINDNYGHDAGDILLKSIANTIKETFRANEGYHISGDEFIIIASGISKDLFNYKIIKLDMLMEKKKIEIFNEIIKVNIEKLAINILEGSNIENATNNLVNVLTEYIRQKTISIINEETKNKIITEILIKTKQEFINIFNTRKEDNLLNKTDNIMQILMQKINEKIKNNEGFMITGELISYGIYYKDKINSPEELASFISIADERLHTYKENFHENNKTKRSSK